MSCNPSALRLKRFCSMARSKEPRSQYCSSIARKWVREGNIQGKVPLPSATAAPHLTHGITLSGLHA